LLAPLAPVRSARIRRLARLPCAARATPAGLFALDYEDD